MKNTIIFIALTTSRIQLVFLFFFLSYYTFSQIPTVNWENVYGGSGDEYSLKTVQLLGGDYILLGTSNSINGDITNNYGSSDIWISRLDQTGNIIWSKSFGGSSDDYGNDIIQLSDQNLVVIGSTYSSDGNVSYKNGEYDAWLLKIDLNGNLIWEKTFGGPTCTVQGQSIIESTNHDLVFACDVVSSGGMVTSNNSAYPSKDIWVVKTDLSGNLIWEMNFGGSVDDTDPDIIEDVDLGYIIGCISNSNDLDVQNNHGRDDFCLFKLDSSGNLLWSNSYGGSGLGFSEQFYDVSKAIDGGYILVGRTFSNDGDVSGNHGGYDIWVVKVDPSGNLLWQKCIGGDSFDSGHRIIPYNNTSYLILGDTGSIDGDFIGLLPSNVGDVLLNIDLNGNVIWKYPFVECCNAYYGWSLLKTLDGGILAGSVTENLNNQFINFHGSYDIRLTKFNPLSSGISLIENDQKKLLKIYDLLGRETIRKYNQIQFYQYDNDTIEKVFIVQP
jgi:hypothetical protein